MRRTGDGGIESQDVSGESESVGENGSDAIIAPIDMNGLAATATRTVTARLIGTGIGIDGDASIDTSATSDYMNNQKPAGENFAGGLFRAVKKETAKHAKKSGIFFCVFRGFRSPPTDNPSKGKELMRRHRAACLCFLE
jgi:hypothetical protein